MTIASQIAGMSGVTAQGVVGTVLDNITAAGTTQATATVIGASHNRVTTCAAGAGVILIRSAAPGDAQYVYNDTANDLLVYPTVGHTIDELATNAGMTVPTKTLAIFKKFTIDTWVCGFLPSSAASLYFAPSGTGAIAGDVQTQLRKFAFLSDYDTAGHFNTVRDALTGTMAVPNLYANGTLTVTGNVTFPTLTAARVPFASTGGLLADNAGFTFNTTGAVLTAGAFYPGSGTVGAPSIAFTADSTTGFYRGGFNTVSYSNAGTETIAFGGGIAVNSSAVVQWSNSTAASSTADVVLVRDASSALALKNGNTPQAFRYYGGNGSFGSLASFNESLTIAAAASTDSATTIPAGAIILSSTVRVTTVIPTAATFTMTTATGGTTLNTAAVSVAANSTDLGTAAGALYTAAGTKIRITPNVQPAAATGVVRLCGYYFLPLAPTS